MESQFLRKFIYFDFYRSILFFIEIMNINIMEYLILKLKLITKLIKLIQQFKSIKSMNIFKLNLYHIYFQVSYFL